MKLTMLNFLIIFIIISTLSIPTTYGYRSQTSTSGGGSSLLAGDRLSNRDKSGASRISNSGGSSVNSGGSGSDQLNIGLIAPHTNFGKRQYSQAITSAIFNLQKMRDTKLGFLQNYEFKTNNVHFDMMTLTPSPTSK